MQGNIQENMLNRQLDILGERGGWSLCVDWSMGKYMCHLWESCPEKGGLRVPSYDCPHLSSSLLLRFICLWTLIISVLPVWDFGLGLQQMSPKILYPGYLVCHLETSIQLSSDLGCLLIWIVELHKSTNIDFFSLDRKNQ